MENSKKKTTHTQLKEKFNILSSWMLVSPSMFSPCAPLDLLYGSPVLTTCTLSKAQPAIWISLWGRGWAKYGRSLFVLHFLPKTAQHVTLEHSNDSLTGKEIYGSQLKKKPQQEYFWSDATSLSLDAALTLTENYSLVPQTIPQNQSIIISDDESI